MPTYPNPPIIEAAIEIRFEDELAADDVKELASLFKETLPIHREQVLHEFQVLIEGKTPLEPKKHDTGKTRIQMSDKDAERSAMVSPESIVISRLPPYETFEELLDFYSSTWSIYYKKIGYRKIARIGLRYINRIDIPFTDGIIDHNRYLNLLIDIPKGFDSIKNYSLTFDQVANEIGGIVKVNSGNGPAALIDHLSFFLDLDVIALRDVPQKEIAVVDLLQRMRDLKNSMFEAFITDETRKLFDG